MGDWIGLAFFILIPVGIIIGLKLLSKGRKSTEQEFEQRANESGSLLTAGVNALNGMLNPGEAKGKEAITEVKKGRFDKKQAKGKDIGEDFENE
jgi:hypothetical protein